MIVTMRSFRRIAVILACLTLPACTAGLFAPPETTFDASSQDAVVVLGVATTHESEKSLLVIPAHWRTSWARMDTHLPNGSGVPNVRKRSGTNGAAGFSTFRHHCGASGGINPTGCDSDYRIPQYSVYVVQPGTYMMTSVLHKGVVTRFASREKSLLRDLSPATNMKTGRVPWFRVGAGEILYVGDVTVDLRKEPARFVGISSAPEKARAALRKYSGIVGTMRTRLMKGPTNR